LEAFDIRTSCPRDILHQAGYAARLLIAVTTAKSGCREAAASLNGDGAGTAIFQACQVFGGQQVPCAVQDSGRIPDALDKRLQWRGVERQEQ
jgi:hypothetical protein